MAKAKQQDLSKEEKLKQALVPLDEQPYEVPSNWVWTRIDRVSDIVTGGTPSKNNEEYYGESFPFIKPADLDQGRHVAFAAEYLSEKGKNVSRIVRAGSTSVCCIGTIGKCGYLEVEATTNQQINTVIPNLNMCDLFVYYYSCSDAFVRQLLESASATTISIVNKSKMSVTKIPLPPLAEQQRIVNVIESLFEKLDKAKELVQSALASFENRKAAILHKAFTGELTAKWRERNGVGMESWEECQLQDVCIINPKRVDIRGIADDVTVTFIPMPAVSEIKGAIVSPEVKSLGEVRKGYTNFSEGDVIFAKITPCMENGKSAVVGKLLNNIGFGSTEFHVLRCSEKLDKQFLYYIVRNQSFRDEAKAAMTGAVGQQRVTKSFLEEYPLNLPTIPEQKEIIQILDLLFEKEEKSKELCEIIEKINLMRKAILARAFRGEMGTNDPNEESAMELLKEVLMK